MGVAQQKEMVDDMKELRNGERLDVSPHGNTRLNILSSLVETLTNYDVRMCM